MIHRHFSDIWLYYAPAPFERASYESRQVFEINIMGRDLQTGVVVAARAGSRKQFAMITDLTIRGKERVRAKGTAFAQVPYAERGTA